MQSQHTVDEKIALKQAAYQKLIQFHGRRVVLGPPADAWIEWKDYDPCRAREVIAIVHWPAMINMRELILREPIYDGDCAVRHSRVPTRK